MTCNNIRSHKTASLRPFPEKRIFRETTQVVKLTPPSLFRVIKEVKANEKKMKKESDLHKTEKRRYEEDFQKHQKDHIDK